MDPGASGRAGGRRIFVTVALAAVLLVGFKTWAQLEVGPAWDTYSFLANAREIAGDSIGYSEFDRPPLMSILAAAVFKLGFVDVAVAQLIDALLAIAAALGMFWLLRERFGDRVGLFGSLALLMSPPVWEWIGVGYTDIGGVALSIWALVAARSATERNSAYYPLAMGLAVLAVLMRHTALLFLPAIALWFAFRANFFRDVKWIASGIGVSLVAYAPFAIFYSKRFGEPLYPYIASLGVQVATETEATPYAIGREFDGFLRSFDTLVAPEALSVLVFAAAALAVAGLVWTAFVFLERLRPSPWRIAIAVTAIAAGAWTFAEGGLLAQQLAVLVGVFAVWKALGPSALRRAEKESDAARAERALDAVMLVWLLAFFAFHENWAQRFDRYYVTMAPGVIYFASIGATGVVRALRSASSRGLPPRAANLAWLPFVVLVPLGLMIDVAGTPFEQDPLVTASANSARYVLAESGDVDDLVVYSDAWPMTSWYLEGEAIAMPFFTDPRAFDHELQKANADYFLSLREQRVRSYAAATEFGRMRVMVPTGEAPDLPRIQYLGAGWENYLEGLDAWRFYLMHDEGNRNMEGSAYLDAYGLEHFQRFDAVAIYGVRWRNLAEGESVLRRYVEQGGTLIVDASANLDRAGFSLSDLSFLDTVMRRERVDPEARFAPVGRFAVEHPEIAAVEPAPWVDPEGQSWYGAVYGPLPTGQRHEVLLTLGGRPAFSVMSLGRGRVFWVGQNIFWHAHATGNRDEARLVRAIFDEILAR